MELNIHFPTDEIAKQVNKIYREIIFEGELPDLGLRVQIRKRAPIEVFCKEGKLHVKAPLEVYTKVIWKEKLLGLLDVMTPNVEETDFEITARFETSIQEDSHWRLSASTEIDFDWDRKPKWNLVVFKVRISSIIKPFIKSKMEEVADQINHFIEKEIQLEKHAETAWEIANAPIQISTNPAIWLNIHPERTQTYRQAIQFGQTDISTQISIPVNLQTTLGKPDPAAKNGDLPAFEEKSGISKTFQTSITSHLPYRELCDLFLGEEMVLDKDRLRFQVRSLGMKLKKEKLNTSLSLQGSIKRLGRRFPFRVIMFVTTFPYIDEEKSRIKIKLYDHAFLTPNWWLRLYSRLAKKAFKKELTKEINLFIASVDERVVREINHALQGREIDEMLRLHGDLTEFKHTALNLSPTGIEVKSELHGELQVKIALDHQSY